MIHLWKCAWSVEMTNSRWKNCNSRPFTSFFWFSRGKLSGERGGVNQLYKHSAACFLTSLAIKEKWILITRVWNRQKKEPCSSDTHSESPCLPVCLFLRALPWPFRVLQTCLRAAVTMKSCRILLRNFCSRWWGVRGITLNHLA